MFKAIQAGDGKSAKAEVTIVGTLAGKAGKPLPPKVDALAAADRQRVHEALAAPGFRAEAGEFAPASARLFVLGLGKRAELNADVLRTIGAKLVKRLDRIAPRSARLLLAATIPDAAVAPDRAGQALGEGMALANWRVDFFAGVASNRKAAHPALTVSADSANITIGLKRGFELGESVNYARRLAATPPNICDPQWIANEARRLARESGLACRVISFEQAKKLDMGGICAVGQGSGIKPCLIVLEHKPSRLAKQARRKKLAAPLVLVGKTITYDTGGYSLKISNGMKGMKYDKCGGMAVLGAMRAIARAKLPVHVVALLPAAENMVSHDSFRPDDIITMYNGVSVEVTNTDAEGRLVLGDALAYACKKLNPGAIVDLATLTGGIVTALGHFCAGVFCEDDRLRGALERAAASSGEKLWRMPLWNDHKEFMRSPHADILNSNSSRNAHPIQGAAFLAYFVDAKIPWAHIDIAGVASVDSDKDLYVQGPTGYGVRLLVDFVRQRADERSESKAPKSRAR